MDIHKLRNLSTYLDGHVPHIKAINIKNADPASEIEASTST